MVTESELTGSVVVVIAEDIVEVKVVVKTEVDISDVMVVIKVSVMTCTDVVTAKFTIGAVGEVDALRSDDKVAVDSGVGTVEVTVVVRTEVDPSEVTVVTMVSVIIWPVVASSTN